MYKNKYVLLFLAMALFVASILFTGQLNAAAPAGYTLVWSDECNGAAGSAVDGTKWNLVNSGGGFGNAELQFYTNRTANSYYDGNGNLVIKTMRETYNGYNYTSAKLFSQNKGDWKYCWIEIRAKLPRGRCVWPAFWMMPTASQYGGWPVGGEIDIVENRGDQMDKVGGTLHFGNPWKYIGASYYLPAGQTFDADYHTFEIEWEPAYFKWYVDGNLYHTRYQNEWYCSGASEATNPFAPFDQQFYLQLNTAVGGPGTPYTGYQSPDDSVFPQHMYIDYVRVYQKDSYPTPTPTPSPPPAAIPGQIEAEAYNAMSGIQTESCEEGGMNVGYIEVGDWMDYDVNVANSGTYLAEYRVASTGTSGRFELRSGSIVLGSYTVPNTGGWQSWTTISGNVTLTAGIQTLRIYATGASWNINWLKFSALGTATPIPTPTPPPATVTPTPTRPPATATPVPTGASMIWYLYNQSVSGVSPDGQNLQTANSSTTGWQPVRAITTTPSYWYSGIQTGTYTAGNWQFILWTNRPASASVVRVEIYATNADGSGAVLIGGEQIDVRSTGGGNHSSTYNFAGIPAVSLSSQRLMVKVFKVSGADATMAYNTNDFPTRLLTPALGTGPTLTPLSATVTPTPTRPPATATPAPTTAPGKVIPGQIEAENYDAMSGIGTEACAEGGQNVGWIEASDWLDYNVTVSSTAIYQAEYRVASTGAAGRFELRRGTTVLASYTVPNTGGWQAWTTVSSNVNLTAGAQTLRILATGSGWNINWLRFSTAIATPTPTPRPTPTPVSDFWDRSGIPTAQNVMIYKFLNRTNGRYTDNEIYWSFNGTTRTLAQQNYIDMPANSAGRVYVSIGAPPNPANPNAYWDFIEHTISSTTWNGNTTRVDAWGLPLALLLHCQDGSEVELGDDQWLFTAGRETVFSTYRNSVPAEFQETATRQYPYKILAPGSCPVFQSGGAYANYFTAYVDQVWAAHGLAIAKPNTQQVFGCSGSMASNPTIAAALNRHTGHLAQASWENTANYYQGAPANYYAKFWHDHGINGLAYGFPYDDVANQAAFASRSNPQYLLIAIGF